MNTILLAIDFNKLGAEALWFFARVFGLCCWVVLFSLKWARRFHIADSFKFVGLFCLIIYVLTLVVLCFVTNKAFIMAFPFTLALCLWEGLDVWYFWDYPGLTDWINDPNRKVGTFGVHTWLGKLLTRRSDVDQKQSAQQASVFRLKVACITMGLMLCVGFGFGFLQNINALAFGAWAVQKTEAEGTAKTKQAVDSAVKRTNAQFTGKFASFTATSTSVAIGVQNSLTAIAFDVRSNGQASKAAALEAKKAANAAKVAAQRPPVMSFYKMNPISPNPSIWVDPSKVKVPPTTFPKRSPKTSFDYETTPNYPRKNIPEFTRLGSPDLVDYVDNE